MTSPLETLSTWIQELILSIGYPGIVLVMAVENIFPPIPSELVLPFGGALSANGEMSFWGVVAAGTVGSVIGAAVLYLVGYMAREAGIRRLVAAYGRYVLISEGDIDRAAQWFERYGESAVLFGRLLPIIRSLISVPAGYTRMNFGKFLLFTTLGTLLWSFLLTFIGRALGENWETISDFTGPYQNAMLGVLVLFAIVFLGWRLYRRRKDR